MNCDTCGTALTEFNATNYRHVHDVGNCAQVLLAQRDNARAALESDRALLKKVEAERNEARDWVRRMHHEQSVLTCVYCGHAYPPGTPPSNAEALTAHVAICPKHPMAADRALLRRIVEAVAEGYVLRQPDNGVHYCRSCSAKSPEWEHNSACRIELHKKAIREFHLLIDEARARIGEGK